MPLGAAEHASHEKTRREVGRLRQRQASIVVAPHALLESYSVLTACLRLTDSLRKLPSNSCVTTSPTGLKFRGWRPPHLESGRLSAGCTRRAGSSHPEHYAVRSSRLH